ncbi:hypothetical protein CC99x_003515 [Candidatus Berkiella cookevillensis]|uniref:SNARE domain protein n=1 Tax=Candidatus Berkiella cookevillensis TaxID=437022 RepID=A0A0Q9Y9W9_9GAMM|nr:hypothetical protein [Candidatus Berkiella cookevillensis]MCS5707966.1 hypothetical protein [Candidatus Berkiella cookevillensis]
MLGNGTPKLFSTSARKVSGDDKSSRKKKLTAETFLNAQHDDIEHVENGVTQLKSLSLDINELINNQNEMVEHIATNTEIGKENMNQGNENIEDAKRHHRHCCCTVL